MRHVHIRHAATTLAAILAAYACSAVAGGYAGIGAGKTTIDVCGDATRLGATRCDDEDKGFKVFGGYVVNDYLAIEGSYTKYGEAGAVGPGFVLSAEAEALAVSLRGSWSLMESLSLIGQLGYARWDTEVEVALANGSDDDGSGTTYGVGLEYALTDAIGVRGEWERADIDGDDVDILSLGLLYRF